jgi:hypothetical protein
MQPFAWHPGWQCAVRAQQLILIHALTPSVPQASAIAARSQAQDVTR